MGKTLLRCAFGLSLILLPLSMFGQSGSDMGQSDSSMHGQDMSATGCLQKGQENRGRRTGHADCRQQAVIMRNGHDACHAVQI